MLVFYTKRRQGCVALSSFWDCLIVDDSPQLDWNVVAEYLTLGTTLTPKTFCRKSCQHDACLVYENLSVG